MIVRDQIQNGFKTFTAVRNAEIQQNPANPADLTTRVTNS